jgi:hypothetical protein
MRFILALLAASGLACAQWQITPNPGDLIRIGSGGGGGGTYPTNKVPQSVVAQTTLTITAATHGLGTNPFAVCYDSATTPRNIVSCQNAIVNTSGDVTFTWSPAFTGGVLLYSAGTGPAGATGATGATGAAGANGTNGTNGANGAIAQVQNAGTNITVRPTINCKNGGCTDNFANNRTDFNFFSLAGTNALGANFETMTDIATPAAPSAGDTAFYSKGGALCAESPSGVETCTGQGTGGGSNLSLARTSNTVLTETVVAPGVNFGSGPNGLVTNIAATTITATLSTACATAGTYWDYFDLTSKIQKVDTSAANFTGVSFGTGITTGSTGATGYPSGVIPIARLFCGSTANQWNTSTGAFTLDLPNVGTTSVVSGAGLTCSVNSSTGIETCSVDSTQVPIGTAQTCGTTSTCSHTAFLGGQIVIGSAPLVSGTPSTVTITGFSPAFTSTSSYVCAATNQTTATGDLLKVVNTSSSSITITGPSTSTDVIGYVCVGN